MSEISNQVEMRRVAKVIRVARKLSGRSQSSLAQAIGVSQSVFSKFEAGKSTPSVIEWHYLCKEMQIHPRAAFEAGIIDHCRESIPGGPYPDARFKIPSKYTRHAGSKVRTTRIFTKYFKAATSEEKLNDYLSYVGIDPDLFAVLDYQINIQFSLDIAQMLIRDGHLKRENLPALTASVASFEVQGNLMKRLLKYPSRAKLFHFLLQNSKLYEMNFDYNLEEETQSYLVISAQPKPIMRHFDYKNDLLGSFLVDYKKEWLRQFSCVLGGEPSEVKIVDDYCKGARKCVYKVLL